MNALLDGPFGQAHQDDFRQARGGIDFHLDRQRVDPDESKGVQLGEHERVPRTACDNSESQWMLLFPQHEIERPTAPNVRPRSAKVAEDVGVRATSVPGTKTCNEFMMHVL